MNSVLIMISIRMNLILNVPSSSHDFGTLDCPYLENNDNLIRLKCLVLPIVWPQKCVSPKREGCMTRIGGVRMFPMVTPGIPTGSIIAPRAALPVYISS